MTLQSREKNIEKAMGDIMKDARGTAGGLKKKKRLLDADPSQKTLLESKGFWSSS